MRGEGEMYELILGYARRDERVRAVILNGSRANPQAVPDRLRDFDVVFLVTEVEPYKTGDISREFGEILVMERTDESELFGDHLPHCANYLMQFADGNRIDLTVARREDYPGYCFDDRLSLVLLDKDGFLPQLPPPNDSSHHLRCPGISLFEECRTEFWWTAPYVSKALLRNQLSLAQNLLETCTRAMLRLMLGWLSGGEHGFARSPGKCGDALEGYLPPGFWERYQGTYARWNRDELWKALFTACALFTEASARAAKLLGFPFNGTLDQNVTEFLHTTQPVVARLPQEPGWDGELKKIAGFRDCGTAAPEQKG